jgi:hypothetical protein
VPQQHLFRSLVELLVQLLLLDLVATPKVEVLNDVNCNDLVARHSCLENLLNGSPITTWRHLVHLKILAFEELAHRIPPVIREVELDEVRKLLDQPLLGLLALRALDHDLIDMEDLVL